jgi:REP element-mobilizing transposase RayT
MRPPLRGLCEFPAWESEGILCTHMFCRPLQVAEFWHAIFPAESAAFAARFQSAFRYVCDEVPVDPSRLGSRYCAVVVLPHHRDKYELYVAVVMPDHVHLILTPLVDERLREIFSLMKIMRAIKGGSGRAINLRLGRHEPVWQEESFDHVLRSSEGLEAKSEYVLQNPVRRGLVADWREYRWAWQKPDRPIAKMKVEARNT